MKKVKFTRRVAAAAVSLALAGGIAAAAPLSADAAQLKPRSNWTYSAIEANGVSYTSEESATANGV